MKCTRKGYQIYAIQVGYTKSRDKMTSLEHLNVIQEFVDIFFESILGFPPRRDIDFTIVLVPSATLVLRTPYHMSILELIEFKIQLWEVLDKGYICPIVSPWGAPILFVWKK